MLIYIPPKAATSIPVVDLDQAEAQVARATHIACARPACSTPPPDLNESF
jgi:hypothetical protein